MSVGEDSIGGTVRTCVRLRQYDLQGCLNLLGLGTLLVVYTTTRRLEGRQLGYQ